MENNNRQGCRWVKCSERLPEKDGLYLIVHNSPGSYGRHEMYFKTEDKKWYWQPNPYSVCGHGFITEWLDESIEPCATSSEWVDGFIRLPKDESKKYFIRWKHRLTKEDEWEVLFAHPSAMVDPKYWKLQWLDERPSPTGDRDFWTEEMIFRFAELYRWSSGRITMKGFKESKEWQTADISVAKENAKEIDTGDRDCEELKKEIKELEQQNKYLDELQDQDQITIEDQSRRISELEKEVERLKGELKLYHDRDNNSDDYR